MACVASFFVLFYVFGTQCNGSYIFCGMALYYIPFVWAFFLIACGSYFAFSKKYPAEKAVNLAIAMTVLAFVLLIGYFRVGEYYANKPYRDEMAAEKTKCARQLAEFYDRYRINNFRDEPSKNEEGKIKSILINFDLFSKDYTGHVKIDARETGLGSTDNGVRFISVDVNAGESFPVEIKYELNPVWRPDSKTTRGRFSINISDDQSTTNDVDWWFSYWTGGDKCLPAIGGVNTLAHLMSNLATKNYLTADFAK